MGENVHRNTSSLTFFQNLLVRSKIGQAVVHEPNHLTSENVKHNTKCGNTTGSMQPAHLKLLFLHPVAFVCWLLLFETQADPIFGTTNGYDVGGPDPMCWSSQLPPEKNTTGKTNDIEQLNELTFNNTFTAESTELGRLLPECYPGTELSLRPVSSELSQMIIGEDFTFELILKADLQMILTGSESIEDVIGPKSTIHVRLQLCDALQQGFCNPIRDTRSKDAALTRDQTDLRVTDNQSDPFVYPDGENKWNYNTSDVLFGIPDQTTISARWCKWALRPITNNSTVYRAALNITMRLPEVRQGAYFFVGHAVMNFQVDDDLKRIDVAQTIPGNVVEVRQAPKILRLTKSMERGLVVVVAILGAMSLVIFAATVYHQKHPVMMISQGPLLSALSFVSTLQIASVYTALPLSDFACRVNGLAVLLPMTLLGSLLVGRMWRMYTALSSVSSLGRLPKDQDHSPNDSSTPSWNFNDFILQVLGFFADVQSQCCRNPGARRNALSGLRRTVTLQQTLSLVFFLVLPQIIYQVTVTTLSERALVIEFDSDQQVGREVCSERFAAGTGIALAVLVFGLSLWLATMSRDLPSAFNEKEHIFLVSTIGATLSFVTLSIIGITDEPSSPPDVIVSTLSSPPK